MSSRSSAVTLIADLALPTGAYYAARAGGLGIYAALIISAAIPAAFVLLRLARGRRPDGLSTYVLVTVLLGLGAAFIGGGERFLLAKEGWLTGVAGLCFLASVRIGRPLAYAFSRPLLEGRARLLPRLPTDSWDDLWQRHAGFRHVWRVASVVWAVGLLADSAARVAMAYTLPPDSVPALGSLLYGATTVVILLVTNVYYIRVGLFDGRSALYREPAGAITCGSATPHGPGAGRSAPAGPPATRWAAAPPTADQRPRQPSC